MKRELRHERGARRAFLFDPSAIDATNRRENGILPMRIEQRNYAGPIVLISRRECQRNEFQRLAICGFEDLPECKPRCGVGVAAGRQCAGHGMRPIARAAAGSQNTIAPGRILVPTEILMAPAASVITLIAAAPLATRYLMAGPMSGAGDARQT